MTRHVPSDEALERKHLSAQADRATSAGPPKVGLIGTGGFGSTHLRHLEELHRQKRLHLVAVAEPAAREMELRMAGLAALGVGWHRDYLELLDTPGLQAVLIATPIPFHLEMISACLDRGLFAHVEKPPVVLIQDLESLIARDVSHRVSVGFQQIETRQMQMLKEWILAGKLGRIDKIDVSASWPRLGDYYRRAWAGRMMWQGRPTFDGPATNAFSHLVHDVMFLAGPAQDAFAVPASIRAELYRVRPIESYDLVCFRGAFASGIRFLVTLGHVTEQRHPFRIRVTGDRDWAEISEDGILRSGLEGICGEADGDMADVACYRACDRFFEVVQGLRPRVSTRLADARGYVLAMNGALLASQGIHSIDPCHVCRYEKNGEDGYDLPELPTWMDRAHQEGLLYGEMGAPWAFPAAREIFIGNLHHCDLLPYASSPAQAL